MRSRKNQNAQINEESVNAENQQEKIMLDKRISHFLKELLTEQKASIFYTF